MPSKQDMHTISSDHYYQIPKEIILQHLYLHGMERSPAPSVDSMYILHLVLQCREDDMCLIIVY